MNVKKAAGRTWRVSSQLPTLKCCNRGSIAGLPFSTAHFHLFQENCRLLIDRSRFLSDGFDSGGLSANQTPRLF